MSTPSSERDVRRASHGRPQAWARALPARLAGCLLLALVYVTGVRAAPSSGELAEQQAQARQERQALRTRIQAVQRDIDASAVSLRDARTALRETETAMSGIRRTLAELAERERTERTQLDALAVQAVQRGDELAERQAALADQLRAQHASGLTPWMALLSGDDPHVVGRDLAYLGYVSRAQADAVQAVRDAMAALAEVQEAAAARQRSVAELVAQAEERRAALQQQQAEHQTVLARVEEALQAQRREARQLASDDQRLGGLVDKLGRALAEQAAAEEAARREAARQAAARRQREAEARAAADAAARAEAARAAAQVRAAQQASPPPAPSPEPSAPPAPSVAAVQLPPPPEAARPPPPAAAAQGMRERSLPWPVRGEVLGRFGAQRPDGGSWRGIVVRARAGATVRAVGAGRVVYADWLAGFGNLLIVDHGQATLTVYAYNQSLLKQVGDPVRAGDVIAEVGASGGQVDPGLYFEIRRQGAPVNPLLWLSPP